MSLPETRPSPLHAGASSQLPLARAVAPRVPLRCVLRLGEGVDATGRLTTGALDRAWHALADYVAVIRATGADGVRMVATSATRDAENRDQFVEMVHATLGQYPEVISGAQEAELTFAGAVAELSPGAGPFLLVDVGGGSTELVVGAGPGEP